ncbi:hypothetical protein [Nocardia sp. alder85J]|uniref:hypothetical protein n=1 Tax=Nocardia sp. alder85J TaxID=2862949 RepID=UPI001CD3FCCE|nr:hypothetical protein [Nocardia sp. alder85J]MCX4092364.1 hypothetical protein [Nocardia sp. alder85J]
MTTPTPLTAGARLRSQTCTTEVIVVRAGSGTVGLTCGGAPMVGLDVPAAAATEPAADLAGGTAVGKRYTAVADPALEVLVTKAGRGTLGDGTAPMVVKTAKTLPASD